MSLSKKLSIGGRPFLQDKVCGMMTVLLNVHYSVLSTTRTRYTAEGRNRLSILKIEEEGGNHFLRKD